MYDRALKLIREYHRMSQKEASEALGMSSSYLSEIENGKKQPSLEVLERYSNLYRIPLSSILLFAESGTDADFAERFRGFAAEKILKILEWLRGAEDVEDGEGDANEAAIGGVLPLRHRLANRSRPPDGRQRRRA